MYRVRQLCQALLQVEGQPVTVRRATAGSADSKYFPLDGMGTSPGDWPRIAKFAPDRVSACVRISPQSKWVT